MSKLKAVNDKDEPKASNDEGEVKEEVKKPKPTLKERMVNLKDSIDASRKNVAAHNAEAEKHSRLILNMEGALSLVAQLIKDEDEPKKE